MSPEAAQFLAKAGEDLDEARQVAAVGLAKLTARSAYYAAFHAAQAFILERTGRIAKTHAGVRSEFARLNTNHLRDRRDLAGEAKLCDLASETLSVGLGAGLAEVVGAEVVVKRAIPEHVVGRREH